MTAKLLLLGAMFIGLPLLSVWGKNLLGITTSVAFFREYCLIGLVLASVAMSFTAAAACTRNVLHCLALWVGIVFATGALADFLNRFAPVLSRPAMARMGMDKALLILSLSVIVALAVILNQYLRRRLAVSVILFLIGAVGATTIGAFWGYFYFYSAQ